MKDKIIKIVLMFLLLSMFLMFFNTYYVHAAIINPLENPNNYNPKDSSEQVGSDKLQEKAELILGVINVVGVSIAVIVLMVIGIKYMIGSVEEKAEYKKTMTAYIIGAMLLFGVTTIANIIYKIVNSTV